MRFVRRVRLHAETSTFRAESCANLALHDRKVQEVVNAILLQNNDEFSIHRVVLQNRESPADRPGSGQCFT